MGSEIRAAHSSYTLAPTDVRVFHLTPRATRGQEEKIKKIKKINDNQNYIKEKNHVHKTIQANTLLKGSSSTLAKVKSRYRRRRTKQTYPNLDPKSSLEFLKKHNNHHQPIETNHITISLNYQDWKLNYMVKK